MNTYFDEDAFNVYKFGVYYNPAFKQYEMVQTIINIMCIRCRKNYLNVCIGWNNKNLCLECAHMIDSFVLSNMIYHNNTINSFIQPITAPVTTYTTIAPVPITPTNVYNPVTQTTTYTTVTPSPPITSYTSITPIPTLY